MLDKHVSTSSAGRSDDPNEQALLREAQPVNAGIARGWWGAAFAVATVGWGANQFAPLLLMYRTHLDLPMSTVEATFGLYAVGLIPGLLLGGPVSDRNGRRRVMVPALVASVAASALLIVGGTGVGWLFAGRLVAGVASGIAFSSGVAWIKELSAVGSSSPSNPGARRATVAMSIGFGVGPLVAGVLVSYNEMCFT